jgi:type IX secretion system PorP/SprF family membrane protein
MRFLLFFTGMICWAAPAAGQQEQQYTQFMFNKMAYNPGYAGSAESPTLTAIYRSQWLGLEGAPSTQMISYSQATLNGRIGLGGNVVRNTIGISRSVTAEFAYSFRIALKRGYLGLGLQPSVRQIRQDWSDPRLRGSQPLITDFAIPTEPKTKMVFNVGFGVFYTGNKWYAGAAVPRIVQNNIDFAEFGGILSREERHINAMGGVTFDLAQGVELTPQILLKYVNNAPLDADINLSLLLKRRLYSGVTYRAGGNTNGAGESLDLLLGVQATKNLFICLSYDVGMTSLRKFHNGSVEATARWWFSVSEGDDVIDPRYPW